MSEELEKCERYKKYADRAPDKYLQFHLDWCIENELYELAAYIQDIAKKRGVELNPPPVHNSLFYLLHY